MPAIVLVVLDGWGIAPAGPANAVSLAKLPNFNRFWRDFPHTTLTASGEAVGLPRGEPGNTETGHLNLGAGRIVYQDLPRINMAIADGSFYKNPALLSAIDHVRKTGGKLHLAGLIGSGGVHSNSEHLFALLALCREQGIARVFLHLFTDGRDSPPTSAKVFIDQVERETASIGVGRIATIAGRYYAMDRDERWDRTEKAYKAMVKGEEIYADSIKEALDHAYGSQITDEFIVPTVIVDKNKKPVATVGRGDAIIFFNFRVDRLRQLTKVFVYDNFEDGVKTKQGFDP
ncbi:phosphoglycerate mutase (2,3-diphosphoglycerate-independent) [Candidatus Gottesmanbacteria bacterium]|nr:phosphoglycerate mutase (2,3-diphosphoglycerate-independent) [Candidatus Gottesmanbacteria bacterium]